MHEISDCHLGERRTLDVSLRDEVEGDVDTPSAIGYSVSVFINRRFVEGIDLRSLDYSSPGADLPSA